MTAATAPAARVRILAACTLDLIVRASNHRGGYPLGWFTVRGTRDGCRP